jgi:predicted metal-dependent hydrolase
MDNSSLAFILASLIIILFYLKEQQIEVTYVKSKADNNKYLVRNTSKKQEAANIIGRLNLKIEKLLEHLQHNKDTKTLYQNIKNKYNSGILSEGTEDSGYTSYSVNKERIVLCVRSRSNDNPLNTFVDENTLLYVTIHEIAHLGTEEVGHTPLFWKNFKTLLTIARDNNIYKYVDYSKHNEKYCGVKLTSNILD